MMTHELHERALVVSPFGRDARVAADVLTQGGVAAMPCADLREACGVAREGVGVIVVAEEAFTTPQLAALTAFLDDQPPWSDLPLVTLAWRRSAQGTGAAPSRALRRYNVSLLERPLSVPTFVAAVQVALRARRRQYEVRSLLEQRSSLLGRERLARERAESASRAKDEFLAMLGHELRNPLAPIVTAIQLLQRRQRGELGHEFTVIDRQVSHLTRLVDDLLDVSRIAQGKVELTREPVTLHEVLGRAVEMASPLLEQRRHHLALSVPPDVTVCGDAMRLAQVFANLLTNAAKYTSPDGHVTVTASREGDEAVVRVRDDGIGIGPEMLPRIFELFVQESQAIDRAAGGLGLGLAIVRNMVALHGGSVAARSEGFGHGSEFEVRLPAIDAAPPRVGAARETPSSPTPTAHAPRVLVVDDNEDAAEMLSVMLMSSGFTVRVAHDGPCALRVAAEFRPDVAVLDIGLPVMDGYELARRMRDELPMAHLGLVALTGYGQSEDMERARQAGFDAHLVKPVDVGRLLETFGRLLAAQRDAQVDAAV